MHINASSSLGHLQQLDDVAPIQGATWYEATAVGDGLRYDFVEGTLAQAKWLAADLLLDDRFIVVFQLKLFEADGDERPFVMSFGLQPQCGARLRVSFEHLMGNRWMLEREGGLLKPLCWSGAVRAERVNRVELSVYRKHGETARWCMTALRATAEEPPRLVTPLLPKGPLLDELGQSTLHDWPGKTRSEREVIERLRLQLADAPFRGWPQAWSRWGGWTEKRFDATGYFRTQHDGRRWWLVDPDGCAFWSTGPDCVRASIDTNIAGLDAALTVPNDRDYLKANLKRAFGETWHGQWATIALAELRRIGFNTVANWSEYEVAQAAGFPYVRPLQWRGMHTPQVFRDFPDVFDPRFEQDAAEFAAQLEPTVGDPALIGYFLMNEPTWGFTPTTPAEGMLLNTDACHCRDALAAHLRQRYVDDAALAHAWAMPITFAAVARGRWPDPTFTNAARADLAAFSTIMVQRLFDTLSTACKRVDPHHLNLGARYYTTPPDWALAGMTSFDAFSINCYDKKLKAAGTEKIARIARRPVMIGEWHFGALDAGLPASGIGHVPDQASRGAAYRVYLEDAAANPHCIGAHWFTLYDQSALGRFDGENYNIGFLDVCHRPYAPLCDAARLSHERLYAVADGQLPSFADAPQHLPMLFL